MNFLRAHPWARRPRPCWSSPCSFLVGYSGVWQWMICRIEVPAGL